MSGPASLPAFNEEEIASRQPGIEQALARVNQQIIDAGGVDVELLAVTKGHPVEVAIAATRCGLTLLGENYAQDMVAKAELLQHLGIAPVRWHFIGQLQTNKVRTIASHVAIWQSVDRIKVGREIAKRSPGATVFAQVNLSDEPQKGGCTFAELDELIDELISLELLVGGLMGVGTASNAVETARGFAQLRNKVDIHGLEHCSMGMSADLELAVKEGSTMVRVGSDLFGPRP